MATARTGVDATGRVTVFDLAGNATDAGSFTFQFAKAGPPPCMLHGGAAGQAAMATGTPATVAPPMPGSVPVTMVGPVARKPEARHVKSGCAAVSGESAPPTLLGALWLLALLAILQRRRA